MRKNTNNDFSEASRTQLLQAGFSLLKTSENPVVSNSCLYCNTIIFILKGSVKIESSHMQSKLVSKQHACFLRMQENYTCEFAPHSKVIFFNFGSPLINELNHFHALLDLPVDPRQAQAVELEIIEPLHSFLKLLIQYLEKGDWDCKLYTSKREELFCLFKKIYSQEKLSYFYCLLANSSLEFEEKTIEKFIKVKTIKDLADLFGYGVHSFRIKFKKVFGITAGQWIRQQKAKLILFHLINDNYDFKTIIDKFGFSSHSHFYKFCKKHYKLIPEELKKRLSK